MSEIKSIGILGLKERDIADPKWWRVTVGIKSFLVFALDKTDASNLAVLSLGRTDRIREDKITTKSLDNSIQSELKNRFTNGEKILSVIPGSLEPLPEPGEVPTAAQLKAYKNKRF